MAGVGQRYFCVAGVALGDIHLDFTWQVWHNLTSTVVLNSVARRRRDSSPREKKWFDAMCEEPFDAVAKVVVHSCGKLNVVLSVFVALTTNSIYIAVLLRPGTFPFWYRHRAYDLRAGAVFFVGHRLKSS